MIFKAFSGNGLVSRRFSEEIKGLCVWGALEETERQPCTLSALTTMFSPIGTGSFSWGQAWESTDGNSGPSCVALGVRLIYFHILERWANTAWWILASPLRASELMLTQSFLQRSLSLGVRKLQPRWMCLQQSGKHAVVHLITYRTD